MAYKAPIFLRLFHFVLWALMIIVVTRFFLVPMFLRATAPQPTSPPISVPVGSTTGTPVSVTPGTGQEPAISVVAP